MVEGMRAITTGTSPRLWGKQITSGHKTTESRNIPTLVGKTPPPCRAPSHGPEHPHACGENYKFLVWSARCVGTSPRLWGKLSLREVSARAVRNIPTLVGKTHGAGRRLRRGSEHPHACGENSLRTNPRYAHLGTSPRLWGKQGKTRASDFVTRNIPTLVGKTATCRSPLPTPTEHPHACGENIILFGVHGCFSGTSPRLWGKRPAP